MFLVPGTIVSLIGFRVEENCDRFSRDLVLVFV